MRIRQSAKRVVILGAAGRDFHNFNLCFRNNPRYRVVAFTASQIPNIAGRRYPKELSGRLYPQGIPIFPEEKLPEVIKKYSVDEVILSYSDLHHMEVMHKASLALSLGCDFRLLGPKETMIPSKRLVISICAVRTGCGKSKVTLEVAKTLAEKGRKVVIVRHPMPYGDLKRQICQRFETLNDLDRAGCTIEEREEYEPIVKAGFVVFAGVDYQMILSRAEADEPDVIVWDGGNNDLPFFKPDLHIVVCDALRPGQEIAWHPGETNFRMANLIIINKINAASRKNAMTIVKNANTINPKAKIVLAKNKIFVDKPELIRKKSVLVIEDGPTVTHGGMSYGAGYLAAVKYGAREILSPYHWARGEIKEILKEYPQTKSVLPALGYSKKQIKELEALINRMPADTVISATPVDLASFLKIRQPVVRVSYKIFGIKKVLKRMIGDVIARH